MLFRSSSALVEHYKERSAAGIDHYSERCLRRIWRAERFSWWFTTLTHRFPDDGPIAAKLQAAELDYLLHSDAGLRTIAENYVGLPLDFGTGTAAPRPPQRRPSARARKLSSTRMSST